MAEDRGRKKLIDPAVATLMGDLERQQEERSVPLKEKQRRQKERKKARSRNRVMYDLPPEITQRIKAIAAAPSLNCPESQVVAALLAYGLAALDAGVLDLNQYKVSSKSRRYDWALEWEQIIESG